MPRIGFEPTIPAFEQKKTVQALDRAVTLIDVWRFSAYQIYKVNAKYKDSILPEELNGEMGNACKIFVSKHKGRRLRWPMLRKEESSNMCPNKIGYEGVK
jgi:hypothetical protein